ncbi:phosphotransferase [Mycolicibacterium thermoresistibile]
MTVDDITPAWLTEVLGATVTEVRTERIAADTGFSALLYRVWLRGDAVPASVVVKLPADSDSRAAMELIGGYQRELTFYQQVADRAPLATPQVYHAHIDTDSADFVLVLEDLGGWENADQLAGLSLDRTRLCLQQLAGLHGWSTVATNTEAVAAFPSLDTEMARQLFLPAFAPGWQVYREHTSVAVPSRVAQFAERFADHAPAALQALTERSMLLHGDIRADNMFFRGDQLKIVDFQLAARGAGVADVAYLVSQGLPTEARRGRDEELLREYLQHLGGQADYPFDEAWRDYRYAAAYLMLLPTIILIGWDGLPPRSRALCLTLVDRAVATIDDIGATEVFG